MAIMINGDGSIRILRDNETLTRGAEKEKVLIVSPKVMPTPSWKDELAEFRKQLEKK